MLKLWRARNLSLEGKITVFKSLALSKITHLALVKTIPPSIIDQLNKTQMNCVWNRLNPKIYIIHKLLGKNFVFHSNLKVYKKLKKSFSKYYRVINSWGSTFSCRTLLSSAILSQFLWFNSQIELGNKSVFYSSFSERNINFVGELFKEDGAVKPWKKLQEVYV